MADDISTVSHRKKQKIKNGLILGQRQSSITG